MIKVYSRIIDARLVPNAGKVVDGLGYAKWDLLKAVKSNPRHDGIYCVFYPLGVMHDELVEGITQGIPDAGPRSYDELGDGWNLEEGYYRMFIDESDFETLCLDS